MIENPTTVEEIKANREEWALALESGGYEQGVWALRQNDAFCCLGVACDLFDDEGWRRINDTTGAFHYHTPYSTHRLRSLIYGSPVASAVGIDGVMQDRLVAANDDRIPFTDIAKIIRELPLPEKPA